MKSRASTFSYVSNDLFCPISFNACYFKICAETNSILAYAEQNRHSTTTPVSCLTLKFCRVCLFTEFGFVKMEVAVLTKRTNYECCYSHKTHRLSTYRCMNHNCRLPSFIIQRLCLLPFNQLCLKKTVVPEPSNLF